MTVRTFEPGERVDTLPPDLTDLTLPLDVLEQHGAQLAKLTTLRRLEIRPPFQGKDQWGRVLSSRLWRCTIPDEVRQLPSLRVLALYDLGLETLPDWLADHPTLEDLYLDLCRFTTLADLVPRLKARLHVENCRLSAAEQRWIHAVGKLPRAQRVREIKPKTSKAVGRRLDQPAWDAIGPLALSPDRTRLYAGQRGGFGVCAWDIASGKLLWTRALADDADIEAHTSISVDLDGKILAAFSLASAGLSVLDPHTGETLRTENTQTFAQHTVVAVGKDQFLLPLMYTRFHTGVFHYPAATPKFAADGPIANASADGSRVCVASRTAKEIHVFEAAELVKQGGKPFSTVKADPEHPHAMTPDGKRIVSLGEDHVAEVFDVDEAKRIETYSWAPDIEASKQKTSYDTWRPAFTPSSERMAIVRSAIKGKLANTIGILDVATGKQVATLPAHARLPGRMDPFYGALYQPEWTKHPVLLFVDETTLAVASVIRADGEPCVGTGVTLHTLELDVVPAAKRRSRGRG